MLETAIKSDLLKFVGWYDSATQTEPTHNPAVNGPCIVCAQPLTPDNVRTINVMWLEGADKSLFYRLHRTCGDSLSDHESQLYDEAVLDAFVAAEVSE